MRMPIFYDHIAIVAADLNRETEVQYSGWGGEAMRVAESLIEACTTYLDASTTAYIPTSSFPTTAQVKARWQT